MPGRTTKRRRSRPSPSRWTTNADFDYAEGVYDSGYGPANKVRVTHTRQVVFVKPDYWLVVDTMKPEDAATHRFESLFHLDAEEAVVDPVEAQDVLVRPALRVGHHRARGHNGLHRQKLHV